MNPYEDAAAGPGPDSPLLMISREEARIMREFARRDPQQKMNAPAREALGAGPWSVAFHRPGQAEALSNDYFSEGLYWWPNPEQPDGPYIRRDGEPNPNRFLANVRDLKAMSNALLALGVGACLLDIPGCVNHASAILEVWFVAPKTRMNPNLEFGQAVPGINSGRGRGIIETALLIYAAQGIMLLEADGSMDASLVRAVRQWFAEYLHWITTSAKGRDESNTKNNHATWWTAQVAAFAIFTGDVAAKRLAWNRYRDYLVPGQIAAGGSCPHEEARTISLSYSAMNLDAFATICRLAQIDGVDLWNFRSSRGIGIASAFHFLAPYLLDPSGWRKQQIEPYNPDSVVFPGLAGIGMPSRDLFSVYDRLPRAPSPWVQFVDLLVRST